MGASTSSNMQPLRLAIIGSGVIGEVHRRAALLVGAALVGAMASTPSRSADAAARWHTQPIASLEDLKSLNVDVVHVCSPNQAHAGHVEAAVAAGAHVICEKPLGVTLEFHGLEEMALCGDVPARARQCN